MSFYIKFHIETTEGGKYLSISTRKEHSLELPSLNSLSAKHDTFRTTHLGTEKYKFLEPSADSKEAKSDNGMNESKEISFEKSLFSNFNEEKSKHPYDSSFDNSLTHNIERHAVKV